VKIEKIEFVCSSPSLKFCPQEEFPEFAFIGRSNVGKSSLINMLASQKGLAKVSGTPGKTRLINHFKVLSANVAAPGTRSISSKSFSWFLVDLPGYGFAKLSKTEKMKFQGLIETYLQKRENLALTFLLIDSRLDPQKIDLEFMNWLGDNEVGFIILFTKTDKLSKTQLTNNITAYRKALAAYWAELPTIIPTSAETKYGREEILAAINEALIHCQ
jgi:GTP-binding protein